MLKNKQTKLPQKTIKITMVVLCILVLTALSFFVGSFLLKYIETPEKLRKIAEENLLLGSVIYILMVFFQVVAAFIPGEPFEIVGGYVFGSVLGTLFCLLGAFLGGVCVFLLVRRFGRGFAEIFFTPEKLNSLNFLKHSKKRDIIFFLIFIMPGTPKDLLCYFAGITNMPFGIWLLISWFGRIPSVITSTLGGNALLEKSYLSAGIIFFVAFLLGVIGLLIYNFVTKEK